MKKVMVAGVVMLVMSGCANNMSANVPVTGGNSSVHLNSNGQASGSVNIGGVNVSTSL